MPGFCVPVPSSVLFAFFFSEKILEWELYQVDAPVLEHTPIPDMVRRYRIAAEVFLKSGARDANNFHVKGIFINTVRQHQPVVTNR